MLKKTLLLFLLLNIFSSCSKNNNKFISHRGSVVKLKIVYNVKVCDGGNCIQANDAAVASGVVVWYKSGTHVLTAAHACSYKTPRHLETKDVKISVKTEISATDLRLNKYDTEIVKINEKDDLCLLKGNLNVWPMTISKRKPKIGNKVYNFGAPAGIFSYEMAPLMHGLYSGNVKPNMSAYTLPSMPGASGSPIVNEQGRLIGMIHSVHEEFRHFVLSPDWETINTFLN